MPRATADTQHPDAQPSQASPEHGFCPPSLARHSQGCHGRPTAHTGQTSHRHSLSSMPPDTAGNASAHWCSPVPLAVRGQKTPLHAHGVSPRSPQGEGPAGLGHAHPGAHTATVAPHRSWRGQALPPPSQRTRPHATAQTPMRDGNGLARLHNPHLAPPTRCCRPGQHSAATAAGAVPSTSLCRTVTMTHSPQLTPSPTSAGKCQGTPSGPSTARGDSSRTPRQSRAELGWRGLALPAQSAAELCTATPAPAERRGPSSSPALTILVCGGAVVQGPSPGPPLLPDLRPRLLGRTLDRCLIAFLPEGKGRGEADSSPGPAGASRTRPSQPWGSVAGDRAVMPLWPGHLCPRSWALQRLHITKDGH